MAKIIVPQLGEGITKATVSYWYFEKGDKVQETQDLVELTTDKATFNLPSPVSGEIKGIFYAEGQDVPIGGVLAEIE